jgi:hypothetical protein
VVTLTNEELELFEALLEAQVSLGVSWIKDINVHQVLERLNRPELPAILQLESGDFYGAATK